VPAVAITIDTEFPDQPAKDPMGALSQQLDVLADRDVRATFFIVGAWARAHPDQVETIRDAGHQIGNHSYSHCPLSRLTARGIVEDLLTCCDVLAGLEIETRPFFRAPQGELGHDDVDVEPAIKKAGYRHIHWHARGEDWRPGITAERVAETVVSEVRERWPRPAIVLLHSWPDPTPRALELILDRLAAEEAGFLTVDQLHWRQALAGRARQVVNRLKTG
jgi:peptidoglycan/xylan/chitin deacetylase (PgdA/CDA1 family)